MKIKPIFALGLFTLINSAHADLLGVEDTVLIAKAAEQVVVLKNQLDQLKQTYETVSNQYAATQSILDRAKAQVASTDELIKRNSGHSGFGSLNNAESNLKNLQWSADNWKETLDGVSNNAQYAALLKAYQDKQALLNAEKFKQGASLDAAKSYEEAVKLNQAASTQSEYAFNDINASLKRVHELSLAIEKAESTKAAIDLNSRMLTELAYLQTQNLKAQSLMNQQLAGAQLLELKGRSQTSSLLAFDDNY